MRDSVGKESLALANELVFVPAAFDAGMGAAVKLDKGFWSLYPLISFASLVVVFIGSVVFVRKSKPDCAKGMTAKTKAG
jgi:hypothetical protein